MPNQNPENQKQQVIYILLSKTTKRFFIAVGNKETLRETYRHHLKLRRESSEEFIKSIAPERPCLFILEEIDSEEEANLLIVWLRILLDNGFVSVNSPTLIEYAENLYYDNRQAYAKRKANDLSQILSCENCYVPRYNRSTCPSYPVQNESENKQEELSSIAVTRRKKDKEIRLRVTQEDYEIICRKAKEADIHLNPYIIRAAKNPNIYVKNYKVISEHTNTISEIRTCINRLIFTIDALNYYLPRDINTIVELMQEVYRTENELLAFLRKEHEKRNKG